MSGVRVYFMHWIVNTPATCSLKARLAAYPTSTCFPCEVETWAASVSASLMMGERWQQHVQEGMAIPLLVSLKTFWLFSCNSCIRNLKVRGS